MARLSLTQALASAGASEEILNLVNLCFERCLTPQDTGRPRQYANRNEQQRAYRERKRREKALAAREALEPAREALAPSPIWQTPVIVAETRVPMRPMVASLKGLLVDAAGWNVDREADVAPILALIDQGCDLEADVLPTVARTVPEQVR